MPGQYSAPDVCGVLPGNGLVPDEIAGFAPVVSGVAGDDGRCFCQIVTGDRGDTACPNGAEMTPSCWARIWPISSA